MINPKFDRTGIDARRMNVRLRPRDLTVQVTGGRYHKRFLGSLFPSLMNPLTKVALIADAYSGSYLSIRSYWESMSLMHGRFNMSSEATHIFIFASYSGIVIFFQNLAYSYG